MSDKPWNLADLWETVVDAVPDQEAMICDDRRLTYRAADERVNRLANVLASRGVGPGDFIGLHLTNGTEYLEGMLAAYKLGAVPANVNYRYVADELRYLFNDSGAKVVVHEPDFAPVIAEVRADCPSLVATIARGDEYEAALAAASPVRPDASGRSGDNLYVLYTGGTTGMPKGVLWRHEDAFFGIFGGGGGGAAPAVTSHAELAERVKANGGAHRVLPLPPFMHGAAHWRALAAMLGGGGVIISTDRNLDPARAWGLADREGAVELCIVGDAFGRPLIDWLADHRDEVTLSSLFVILSGGAILSPSLKERFAELLPATLVIDGFGASETGGQGSMVGRGEGVHPRFAMDTNTTVLDDDGNRIEPGSGGEGWLARTGHIPLGYKGDEAKTAATFKTFDGKRWAIPGDRATVEADGTITVFGRGSVSINSGGEKIFPEEVEAALKGHPDVFDAIVVGLPDERWGQRVTAVVQLRAGHPDPGLASLAAHARTQIAAYKVPRALVLADEVVRSPSGKPDYRWAKQFALDATT